MLQGINHYGLIAPASYTSVSLLSNNLRRSHSMPVPRMREIANASKGTWGPNPDLVATLKCQTSNAPDFEISEKLGKNETYTIGSSKSCEIWQVISLFSLSSFNSLLSSIVYLALRRSTARSMLQVEKERWIT